MAKNHFENQLAWLRGAKGEAQRAAGAVIIWQGVSSSLNELVTRFNEISRREVNDAMTTHRQIHLKKLIVGLLFEVKACFAAWAGSLKLNGKLTDAIKQDLAAFHAALAQTGIED